MDIKKLMREAYLPVVDAIVENFYGLYEIYYDKLKALPEEERDKLVSDAITNVAEQMKSMYSMIKPEEIIKNIK